MGSIEHPINPIRAAIAAEATWVGRSVDVDTKHLPVMIEKMAAHKGVSFLEVLQNCIVFNDGAFDAYTEKSVRPENLLYLEPNEPLKFGKEMDKAIDIRCRKSAVVELAVVDRVVAEVARLDRGQHLGPHVRVEPAVLLQLIGIDPDDRAVPFRAHRHSPCLRSRPALARDAPGAYTRSRTK